MSSLLIMLATICVHNLHSKIYYVTDPVPAKGTEIFIKSMVDVPKRGNLLTRKHVPCSLLCLRRWTFVDNLDWGADLELTGITKKLIAQCSAEVKMKPMKRIVLSSAFMLYKPTIDVLATVPLMQSGAYFDGENVFRAIPSILYGRYNKKKATWIMKHEKRNLKSRYYERALFETAEVGNGVYHIKNHLAWKTTGFTRFKELIGFKSSKLEKGKLFLKYNENGVTFTTGNVEECGDACKWKLVQSQVSTIATLKSKQYRVKLLYRWQPIVAFDAIAIALASETREGQAPRTLEEAG
eukprot:128532_1